MFTANFHVPGAKTDTAAKHIIALSEKYKNKSFLDPAEVRPIIPAVESLTKELTKANVSGSSTDSDVIINEALEQAKQAGLNQLNEFHKARVAGRLSAGHTEDPHTVAFIENHGLNQGMSQYTLETIGALHTLSWKLADKALIDESLSELHKDQRIQSRTSLEGELAGRQAPNWKEKEIARLDHVIQTLTSSRFKDASAEVKLLQKERQDFLNHPKYHNDLKIQNLKARIKSLSKEIQEIDEKASIHANLLQQDALNQAREALIAVALLRKHALLKQILPVFLRKAESARAVLAKTERKLQEDEYRKAGLTGDDLTDQMNEYDQDIRDALKNQQFTDTSYATTKQLSEHISNALGVSTTQLSEALRAHGQKLSEATMFVGQEARRVNAMASSQDYLLSRIYDQFSQSAPQTSASKGKNSRFSNALNDTYHVVRSLEGGKDLLLSAISLASNAGCHIM